MDSCIKCPIDHWSNTMRSLCIKRSEDFLSYKEPLGVSLAVFALLFTVLTVVVLVLFVKCRNSPIIKANNRNLSYILLVALMLSFLCSLSFIGHPLKVTCLLRQAIFGTIFTIVVASILGKTVTVVIAFNATKPGSSLRKCLGPKLSMGIVFFCTLVQVVICVTWLLCAPPFVDIDITANHDKMVLKCNEGSMLAFCILISYIGILALFSFVVAFIARKLPDRYNETKYITFSLLMFCCVWVTFIPTYFGTKGKYVVAVEIFAILSSTVGILGCIFTPKCYMLLSKWGRIKERHVTSVT
ncbi:vomeronasal type-2 receptor 26-like [Pelodytes ibericus]